MFNSDRKKFFAAVALFTLFTGILFRHFFISGKVPFPGNLLVSFYQPWASYPRDGYNNGPAAKPIGFDNLRMFYPLRKVATDQIKNGVLPLWNQYSFSGNVLLGAYQSAVFFPFGFLFLLLPQINAWSLIIIMTPILTASFMYYFLRTLSLGSRSSFFGAVTFAFSGVMIVWWEEMFMSTYSFLPIPLVFTAIYKLSRKPNYVFYILLIASLVFSILSGYFQTTFYLFVAAFIWSVFLFATNTKNIKSFLLIISGFITALLLCGFQLVPAFEAYLLSPRITVDVKEMFNQFFAPLQHLVTFIAPDYFGNPATHNYFGASFYHEKVIWIGIPALLFTIYEIIRLRKNKKHELFFIVTGIISLSFAFSLPTSWFILYRLKLPLVSEMTPSRIVYLSSFCFAVVSAFGLEHYLLKNEIKKLLIAIFMIVAATAAGWYFALTVYPRYEIPIHALVPYRNLILPTIMLVATCFIILSGLKEGKSKKVTYLALMIITGFGIFYFANKYLYFSEKKYVFPQTAVTTELKKLSGINRFFSLGDAYINTNFSNFFGLYSPEGYESFNNRRYSELLYSSHTQGKYSVNLQRADATIYPAKNMSELTANHYSSRLLDLLGVKYIVAKHDSQNPTPEKINGLVPVWTDNVFDIYENRRVIPRYFFTDSFVIIADNQKILDKLYAKDTNLAKTLILEKNPGQLIIPAKVSGEIKLSLYSADKVEFSTKTDNPSLLFFSDSYSPGWKANIDGKETEILQADYAFRSVVVPPGHHNVQFIYQPKSLAIGLSLTLSAIPLLIVVYYLLYK